MNKQQGIQQIEKLVKKYEGLTPSQRKGCNESMTCKDFILPLFQALGWDVYNNFSSTEVTSEKQVSGKIADYAFHVNDVIRFFIEAKKFEVDLREERWGEQAIMYAWHKSVPWAILTDFESIKVFNAEWDEPDPERSLIFEIHYKDYLTDEKLWWLSKKSFEKGELDKFAEENFKKPKREPVDKQLASDLIKWRGSLYNDLRGWNSDKKLSDKQFSDSVQKIINRLIFIRTTEDRKIEGEKLREIARNWEENKKQNDFIEKELKKLFQFYWDHYDSKLFKEHICDTLEYENNLMADVIRDLYKNKKGIRYNFASINADVLGSVYEQYLGHIQQEEDDKKKSKRKSQGIYYTPRYIVDYIVKNTLGEILKGKSGHEASKIKILDPACGSGSFLIKAFEVLDRHIKVENNQLNAQSMTNYARKIGILTSNIYGVDLDEEAVEIAQLNLTIKALETRELLPNLSHNIECGNSLISGSEEELKKYFGKDWKAKKPFNWKDEFKDVFKQGGFDVVIGNPPYIKEFVEKSAFDGLHDSPYYQGKMDIWTLFACTAIDLLKDGGYFSFIAPNSWLTNAGASIFRDKILQEGEIISFVDFGDYKVFQDAGIQTMIFVFKKCKPRKSYKVVYSKVEDKNIKEEELIDFLKSNKQATSSKIVNFEIAINPQQLIGNNISFVNSEKDNILQKIESKKNFELNKEEVANGIHPHHDCVNKKMLEILGNNFKVGDGIFVLSNSEKKNLELNIKEQELIKPFYNVKQIHKYYCDPNNKDWIIYTDSRFKNPEFIKPYPNIKEHLDKFQDVISSSNKPYGLHRAREENFFKGDKIIVVRKCIEPQFTYSNFDCYVSATYYVIKSERVNLKYLTGLLNSKLITFWLKHKGKMQGDNFQLDKEPLLRIPIVIPNNQKEKEIIKLTDKITKLIEKLQTLHPIMDEEEYNGIKEEIEKVDKYINEIVYELYGLGEEEIKVVENN